MLCWPWMSRCVFMHHVSLVSWCALLAVALKTRLPSSPSAVRLERTKLGLGGGCDMSGAGGLPGLGARYADLSAYFGGDVLAGGLGGNIWTIVGYGAGDERDEVDRVFPFRIGDLRSGPAMAAHGMFKRLQRSNLLQYCRGRFRRRRISKRLVV